jgi:alcohol dehydrogenase class IV
MFDFSLNTHIKFGCGVRHMLEEILAKEQWSRIGLVVDHNLMTLPIIKDIIKRLDKRNTLLVLGKCTISEPTYAALEEMRTTFADPSLEAVIGLGGGSALDMAKAMAVLVHNRKPAIEYRGFDKMDQPVLPIVAIPTTAGTGSEVTPNASFIDSQAKKKMGINGEAVRPRYAFLDPELTVSCPQGATISAATDSLVHAVEAYVAKKTNVMARLFAREGLRHVYRGLPKVICDLEDVEAREEVMYGAFLAGIALMHSGTGPAAAMSYPLGVHYGVPHGLGGAIFLPKVMEHNIREGYVAYADLYDCLGNNDREPNQERRAQKVLEKFGALWLHLGIPQDLKFCGFDPSAGSKEAFLRETLELKGALEQNPVPFGTAEVMAVLDGLADI